MDFLIQFVETAGNWSYLVLFIALFLEGEVVVMFFAFLASLGVFNPL